MSSQSDEVDSCNSSEDQTSTGEMDVDEDSLKRNDGVRNKTNRQDKFSNPETEEIKEKDNVQLNSTDTKDGIESETAEIGVNTNTDEMNPVLENSSKKERDISDDTEESLEAFRDSDGIVVNENDIVKSTDVFGKGKRPHKKKKMEEYDCDGEKPNTGTKPKRGRPPSGKTINTISASESKENTKDLHMSPQHSKKLKTKTLSPETRKMLEVPLSQGWRREVVIRNVFDPNAKSSSRADVYYHPPSGRKLRSMVEIVKYLVMTNSDLTQENFTFQKSALLEPPHEVVRYASASKGAFTPSPNRKIQKDVQSPSQKKRHEGKPEVYIDRDGDEPQNEYDEEKKLLYLVTDDVSGSEKIKESQGKSGNLPGQKSHGKPGRPSGQKRKRSLLESTDTVEVIKQDADDYNVDFLNSPEREEKDTVEISPAASKVKLPFAKKYKPTARKSTTPKSSKVTNLSSSPNDRIQGKGAPCTLNCPGRNNTHPSLQCDACQCLFHPECVGANPSTLPFLCLNCCKTITPIQPRIPLPTSTILYPISSLTPMSALVSNGIKTEPMDTINIPRISPETMQNLKNVIAKTKLPTSSHGNSVLKESLDRGPLVPTVVQTVLSDSKPSDNQNANTPPLTNVSAVSSTKSPKGLLDVSNIQPPKLKAAPHVSPVKSIPNPLPTNGIDMKDAAKNGQLLTLPAAVAKRLNLNQPLALKINNMQITVPSSCFLHTNEGLKVFLPPKTFPVQIGETAKLSVTVTNDKTSANNNTSISVKIGDEANVLDKSESKKDTTVAPSTSPEKKHNSRSKCAKQSIRTANCYIKKLYGGADCMLEIFKYLNMTDLLSLSLVCKSWRKLSMHPCLWKEVKFRGMIVHDWEKTVTFLLKRAVHCMNLKGLNHVEERNTTWKKVICNLPKLTSVSTVHFGQVPGFVLHALCERMTQLEVFTAKWISDYEDEDKIWTCTTKLNFGAFGSLTNLKELRLRGMGGLVLPSISLSEGLIELASLEKLTILSLTSLTDVPEENFSFLSSLTQLEVLELGNCTDWTAKTFNLIGPLSNLRKLRLECGGDIKDNGLADSLLKLKKLETLELIMFILDQNLASPISILTEKQNLKNLVLWPDTTSSPAQMNSTALSIISKLEKLQQLEWGIVSDQKSQIILEGEPMKQEGSDSDKEWIPFLHRDAWSNSGAKTAVEYIKVTSLTSDLSQKLPNTNIKICKSQMISANKNMEMEGNDHQGGKTEGNDHQGGKME